MKVDIGFWDINGNYIEDIQEIGAEEMKDFDTKDTKHIDESNQEYIAKQNMDKNFNEFFDELNDMANFKNFGESKDKEIIIDGVDVTGCCYYESKNDTGKWCDLTCTKEHAPYFRCESMSNCYYKQLKRLEQENARLKEKFEIESLTDKITGETIYRSNLVNKYRTTLQEIKEVVKAYMPEKQGDYRFSKLLNPSLYKLLEQILDLITKAEEK